MSTKSPFWCNLISETVLMENSCRLRRPHIPTPLQTPKDIAFHPPKTFIFIQHQMILGLTTSLTVKNVFNSVKHVPPLTIHLRFS